MGLNIVLHWFLTLAGDGSSTTATVNVATAPFVMTGIPPSFSISATPPVAVANVGASTGQDITASLSSGSLTITFPSAPAAGAQVVVQGDFLF